MPKAGIVRPDDDFLIILYDGEIDVYKRQDGYLIVANAETLKKEAGYKTELEDKVSSPTHVAVLGDDDIYLRDNEGIKVFHPSSGELFLIEGAERANRCV